MTPYFFGYGSLVNRATHNYPDPYLARLRGWRRVWVRTMRRGVVFLTVRPDANTTIDGLIAAVPGADWQALDAREAGYTRHASGTAVLHNLTPPPQIAHYAIPPDKQKHGGDHVILLSYLDVVVQGYLAEYGEAGVADFFATTDGWDTPLQNDRDAPLYPRHQKLDADTKALVDHHLERKSARVI